MFRKLAISAMVLALAAVLILGAQPAANVQAFADVDFAAQTCSSFQAQGTSNSPYVIVYVDHWNGSMWEYYWEAFPVVDGEYVALMSFSALAFDAGDVVSYYVWGSPIPDWNGWDNEDYYYDSQPCDVGAPGPTHPASFVQLTITCDIPVYAEPGGAAVADTLLTAGQDWHINPVGEAAADGTIWHEIFVGSNELGWVPASCVATG